MNDKQKDDIRKYNSEGHTNRDIARRLGVHHNTIAYQMKKMGISSPFCNQPIDLVGEDKARCSKCKEIKNIDEFQFGRKGQKYEYKFSYCNKCRKTQTYKALNQSIKQFLRDKFTRLKARAKKNNIEITVDAQYLFDLYDIQNGLCFYTNREMKWGVGKGRQKNQTISIDKVIPVLGYIPGNIVLCVNQVNTVKNNLTLEEIEQWLPPWYEKIKNLPEFELLKEASNNENDS
jgi:hypothetical protein